MKLTVLTVVALGCLLGQTLAAIPIVVKNLENKVLKLEVKPEQTILEVKEQIGERINMISQELRLIFGGKNLDDASTVAEVGFKENSLVRLLISKLPNFEAIVETQTGSVMRVSMRPDARLSYLRRRVYKAENLPTHQQRLMYKGKELTGDRRVLAYGFQPGDRIKCFLSIGKNMPIAVETGPSETVTIFAHPNATVEFVKDKIMGAISKPTRSMQLSFQGQQLENSKTLSEYGIVDDSKLKLELTQAEP